MSKLFSLRSWVRIRSSNYDSEYPNTTCKTGCAKKPVKADLPARLRVVAATARKREAVSAEAGNPASGPFGKTQGMLFQHPAKMGHQTLWDQAASE